MPAAGACRFSTSPMSRSRSHCSLPVRTEVQRQHSQNSGCRQWSTLGLGLGTNSLISVFGSANGTRQGRQAWRVPIDQIRAGNYNLDLKNTYNSDAGPATWNTFCRNTSGYVAVLVRIGDKPSTWICKHCAVEWPAAKGSVAARWGCVSEVLQRLLGIDQPVLATCSLRNRRILAGFSIPRALLLRRTTSARAGISSGFLSARFAVRNERTGGPRCHRRPYLLATRLPFCTRSSGKSALFDSRRSSASMDPKSSIKRATSPVQPVW